MVNKQLIHTMDKEMLRLMYREKTGRAHSHTNTCYCSALSHASVRAFDHGEPCIYDSYCIGMCICVRVSVHAPYYRVDKKVFGKKIEKTTDGQPVWLQS